MATFILVLAIITALSLLFAIYRFNDQVARYKPIETKVYPQGQPLYFANTLGKWLLLSGGLATAPLIMALIFMPNGSPDWIITLGLLGLVSLPVAALFLGFVFVKNCLLRKLKMGAILLKIVQQPANKTKSFFQTKMVSRITGVIILIVLLPFLLQAITTLLFVIGFVMAARLGLLDHVGDEERITDIDYVQEGIDYDFFYGTNEYNSFPDN